jgi:GT2 family glycosyltransferase
MAPTWIVVLHYCGPDDTLECLRSLQRQQAAECRVLVIDNASSDDVATHFAREFPNVIVVRSERNLGWAGGNNVGIRYALERGAERILLLNNDVVADPFLVARLARADLQNPEYAVFGAIIRDLDPPGAVQSDGFLFNDASRKGFFNSAGSVGAVGAVGSAAVHERPEVVPADIVMGCCLWVRKEVLESIGLLDERFFLIHEESDFCLRAARAGFKVGVVAEALVRHRRSTSFLEAERRTGAAWQSYFDARNLGLLLWKHAGRGVGSRGRWRSLFLYVFHIYYYHAHAAERNQRRAARAIADGFVDFVLRRWGPYVDRSRRLGTLVDVVLQALATARNLVRRQVNSRYSRRWNRQAPNASNATPTATSVANAVSPETGMNCRADNGWNPSDDPSSNIMQRQ